jgi:antitoxin PrlF
MLLKLSSKGRLTIPKAIREELGLAPGTRFHVELVEGRIILAPIPPPPLDALYGKYGGDGFLAELEREHRHEMASDEGPIRP